MVAITNVKQILVIQTAFIGDAILITSLLESIHAAHPTWKIDLLVRKGNEQLFYSHPFVREVLIWDKERAKYESLGKLLLRIRSKSYHAILNAQRYGATGLLTAFGKSTLKIGFSKNPFSFLFTHQRQHAIGNGLHEIERNFKLALPLGNIELKMPKLYPSEEQKKIALELVHAEQYICIAPASVWFTKQYPVDKWISFIQKLPQELHIVLLGAPSDKMTCKNIQKKCPNHSVQNLAGKCDLLTSAAIMENANMNYVNDSAPLHLCSAMDAPVTAIFCSTVPSFGFTPLSQNQFIIETHQPLDCRPCGIHGKRGCHKTTFDCARSITDEQLLDCL